MEDGLGDGLGDGILKFNNNNHLEHIPPESFQKSVLNLSEIEQVLSNEVTEKLCIHDTSHHFTDEVVLQIEKVLSKELPQHSSRNPKGLNKPPEFQIDKHTAKYENPQTSSPIIGKLS